MSGETALKILWTNGTIKKKKEFLEKQKCERSPDLHILACLEGTSGSWQEINEQQQKPDNPSLITGYQSNIYSTNM